MTPILICIMHANYFISMLLPQYWVRPNIPRWNTNNNRLTLVNPLSIFFLCLPWWIQCWSHLLHLVRGSSDDMLPVMTLICLCPMRLLYCPIDYKLVKNCLCSLNNPRFVMKTVTPIPRQLTTFPSVAFWFHVHLFMYFIR